MRAMDSGYWSGMEATIEFIIGSAGAVWPLALARRCDWQVCKDAGQKSIVFGIRGMSHHPTRYYSNLGDGPATDFFSVAPELGIAAGIVHAG